MSINYELTMFFLQISIMLITAIVFSQIVKKIGQPSIVGELLAGIIIGPTVLNMIIPNIYIVLFPTKPAISSEINSFIQFGMILYMFISGLKINTEFLAIRKKTVFLTSFLGIVIPFLLGVVSVIMIPSLLYAPQNDNKLMYAICIGVVLSISALPVIIKTLNDLELSESEIGTIIIGSATIDDIVGWTMFACLINSISNNGSIFSIFRSLLQTFVFIILLCTVGSFFIRKIFHLVSTHLQSTTIKLSTVVVFTMFVSAIAERCGIHPFFAAFILGITLKKEFDINGLDTKNIISDITKSIFVPLYFVSVGMKVNFIKNFDLKLVLIIFLIACIGKIVGASLGAMIGGIKWKVSLAIGFGMNSRGAIEILIASTAVELNLIGQQMYVALIIMAICTSIISSPIIKKLTSPIEYL